MNIVTVIPGKPGLVLRKVKGKMKTSTVETRYKYLSIIDSHFALILLLNSGSYTSVHPLCRYVVRYVKNNN
jgi:hypothetical protein